MANYHPQKYICTYSVNAYTILVKKKQSDIKHLSQYLSLYLNIYTYYLYLLISK